MSRDASPASPVLKAIRLFSFFFFAFLVLFDFLPFDTATLDCMLDATVPSSREHGHALRKSNGSPGSLEEKKNLGSLFHEKIGSTLDHAHVCYQLRVRF